MVSPSSLKFQLVVIENGTYYMWMNIIFGMVDFSLILMI
jgi:hypothetical protein